MICRQNGLKSIFYVPVWYKNEDGSLRYPFALANIDGLVDINGKLGIFEAKTTSTRSHAVRDYWEKGIIPPYYYWQVVFTWLS